MQLASWQQPQASQVSHQSDDMLLQIYNPVLAWANQQFDVKFAVSNSIFGAHQNADTHQAVRQFLQGKITQDITHQHNKSISAATIHAIFA